MTSFVGQSIVVMGVSGSGKTTIAQRLASRLGATFLDADTLHSKESIEQMASGHALSDAQRAPWLRSVGEAMANIACEGAQPVVACSALRRSYRNLLRDFAPDAFFIHLAGPLDVIRSRMEARRDSYMPTTLLPSQFATLEPLGEDEAGVTLDATLGPEEITELAVTALESL
jgi:gluconokinase